MAILKENYEDQKIINLLRASAVAKELKIKSEPTIMYLIKKVNVLEQELNEIEQCESFKETGKFCFYHHILYTILENEVKCVTYLMNMSMN